MLTARCSRKILGIVAVGTLLVCPPVGSSRTGFAQEAEDTYRYDPSGKRDPFFSPLYRVTEQAPMTNEARTPLQRLDLGQFKVVGILLETGEPKALIEDNSGLGYIVTLGTLIGSKGGVIKSIEPDRILVEEYETDFYGKRQTLERELSLTVVDSTAESQTTKAK